MNDSNLVFSIRIGMLVAGAIGIFAILLNPTCSRPDDFPSKGDVIYFWPGRMILPPESSVAEWSREEPELTTDPAPQCIPENEACEFPTE